MNPYTKGTVMAVIFVLFEFPFFDYPNDPKFSDRYVWANSADPDQTAPLEEQSDQGLHCLLFNLHHFDQITLRVGPFV